jgi:hypothetical protein
MNSPTPTTIQADELAILKTIITYEFQKPGRAAIGYPVSRDCLWGVEEFGGAMERLQEAGLVDANETACWVTKAGYDLVTGGVS